VGAFLKGQSLIGGTSDNLLIHLIYSMANDLITLLVSGLFALIGIFTPYQTVAAEEQVLMSQEIACVESIDPMKTYLRTLAPEDYDLLAKIVKCESGWNAKAKNKASTASGLAQFLDSTWSNTRQRMGLGDKLNWRQHLETFVWLYQHDGSRHWLESKPCWSK
jgi:hypothetical protein